MFLFRLRGPYGTIFEAGSYVSKNVAVNRYGTLATSIESDEARLHLQDGPSRPTVSVVVPTYRRTRDLGRCLDALEKQTRAADRIIVVCRDSDDESTTFLAERRRATKLAFEVVTVTAPGQVASLNAALARIAEGIVSFTDDDAAPRPDWLARIEAHFAADLAVGGVGGRDYIGGEVADKEMERVGIVAWYGRPTGNHHLGTGPARYVDILKGANMSYRMAAVGDIRFDTRLRGAGAQRNNDLAFSLALRARGWKLVYDPAVAVDHYPADRRDGAGRSELSANTIRDGAFNETLAILGYLPRRYATLFLLWAFAIGTPDLPGVAQSLRNRSRHPAIWKLFFTMVRSRLGAAKFI